MSGNKKNTSHYSSLDIRKYLRGELSAPEMNALEKVALDDPFLADALEGIGSAHSAGEEASFQDGLNDLKKRLDDRIGRKNQKAPIPLRRSTWMAAASVILLAGLGMAVYYFSGSSSKMSATRIAKADRPAPDASATAPVAPGAGTPDAGPTASRSDSDSASTSQAGAVARTEDREKPNAPAGEQMKGRSKAKIPDAEKEFDVKNEVDTVAEPRALAFSDTKERKARQDRMTFLQNAPKKEFLRDLKSTAANNNALPSFRTGPSNSNNAPGSANNALASNSSPAVANEDLLKKKYYAEDKYIKDDKYIFTGKVIDENNLPVTGATLFLADRPNLSAVSDNKGVFQLKVGKIDSSLRLMVNYVGYEPMSMELNTDNIAGNLIQLRPVNNSLNEVIVPGFGSQKKKRIAGTAGYPDSASIAASPKIIAKNAAPVDGLPAWAGWLEKNWRTAGANLGRKGNETVSFIVNKNGLVSDFRIEQSISPAHDSMLVDLIRQGPAWKLQKGKKSRVTVTAPL